VCEKKNRFHNQSGLAGRWSLTAGGVVPSEGWGGGRSYEGGKTHGRLGGGGFSGLSSIFLT